MKKDRIKPDLEQEALKKQPFGVPEGYFESFAERLHQRIKEEESSSVPARKIGTPARWLAMAAAMLAAALIITSVIRFTSGNDTEGLYPDMAILEQMQLLEDDRYLYEMYEEQAVEMLEMDSAFTVKKDDWGRRIARLTSN